MTNTFDPVTITNYNATPPSDDGTQTAANEITWAKHKDKLGDPLKTAIEGLNTNISAAFDESWPQNGVVTIAATTTVTAAQRGSHFEISSGAQLDLLDAASATSGFMISVRNAGATDVVIDPNGSETINGAATLTLTTGASALIICDGSSWFAPVTDSVFAADGTYTGDNTFSGTSDFSGAVDFTGATTVDSNPVAIIDLTGAAQGLTLKPDTGDPTHDINVAAGAVAYNDNSGTFILATEMTKQADAAWAAGDDAGGLGNGISLPANGTLHMHACTVDSGGASDFFFDTDPGGANPPTGTTWREYVGSFTVLTSLIVHFSNIGDEFLLTTVVQSDDDNPPASTNAILTALAIPTGIKFEGIFTLQLQADGGASTSLLVTSPDQTDSPPSSGLLTVRVSGSTDADTQFAQSGIMRVRTDTSAQVRYRIAGVSNSERVRVWTHGWKIIR